MVTYIPKSQWGGRAANGSRSLVIDSVINTAWHYPGMAKPINAIGDAGFRRVCSALRGWQNYHMDDRGWSDIAYQVAVDQAGRAYTLRGINIQSAANGDQNVNIRYGGMLLVVGPGEPLTPALVSTAKAVMADYRKRYPRIPKRPTWHGAIRPGGTASDPSTDCPGKVVIAAIKAGQLDAGAASTPKPPVTPPALDEWEEIMALFNSKDEFIAAVAAGTEQGIRNYGKAFFSDEQGTGDTIWDEARESQASTKDLLTKIETNTRPKS